MNMKWLSACLLVAYSAAGIAMEGEIRVYLNPDAGASTILCLGDVANVEAAEQSDIADIVIPEPLYHDGYLEASEVRGLLNKIHPGLAIRVFGSAVRIVKKRANESTHNNSADEKFTMRNGDIVDVVLRHKGIVVRTFGTALSDGKKGDRIIVKTAHSRRLSGKVSGRGMVEVLP